MCATKKPVYGDCEYCEAWSGWNQSSRGKCRRHPPNIKAENFDPEYPHYEHPMTVGSEGCFDFLDESDYKESTTPRLKPRACL